MSDLQCNYVGFHSRQHLVDYVEFYRPLVSHFFDDAYQPRRDLSAVVRSNTTNYRNEKPFTFLLEYLSHLFFFVRRQKIFALHYDGYYEVDEAKTKLKRLERIQVPWPREIRWRLSWEAWRLFVRAREAAMPFYSGLPAPVRETYRGAKAAMRSRLAAQ